jgi:hypothetical protein
MQSKLVNRTDTVAQIDPNTVFRLPEKKEKPTGPYSSRLNIIPSKIVPPETFGSYELTKHSKLPSINHC